MPWEVLNTETQNQSKTTDLFSYRHAQMYSHSACTGDNSHATVKYDKELPVQMTDEKIKPFKL